MACGKAVEAVGCRLIKAARGMVATALLKGTIPDKTQHRVHWSLPDGRTETVGDNDTSGLMEQSKHNVHFCEGTEKQEQDNPGRVGGKRAAKTVAERERTPSKQQTPQMTELRWTLPG